MKATRFSMTFVAFALCGSGLAGPCKPRSSTALVETTSTEATLSASTELSSATSVAEPSTTDLSSIISESLTSTATATSDFQFSSTTELLSASVTTETATATTSAAELSSTVETFTASTTAEATTSEASTSEAPITTTAEVSVPFEPLSQPDITDSVSPLSVSITSDFAHSGFHSAYSTIENTAQNGGVSQTVDLEQFTFYTLSYWWYIDEDAQPQNVDCYMLVDQTSIDGLTATSAGFQPLTTPLPLKTWTKRETIFNSFNIAPAEMGVSVVCGDSAGSGFKVAIDDVSVAKLLT